MPDVKRRTTGRPSPEIRRLSDTLARDPGSLVFLRLGDALRREGRLDQALRVAETGIARHPDLVDAHALLGRVAADAGRLVQAEACWREVERLAPGHVDAARGLAFIRWCEGRVGEARELLEEAFARTTDESTRRSITAAFAHLDGTPVRRVIAPTPHVNMAAPDEPPAAPAHGFVKVPDDVANAVHAVVTDANALGDALQIGAWRAMVLECDQGLLGVSLGGDNGARAEPCVVMSDALPLGRAVRELLDRAGEKGP